MGKILCVAEKPSIAKAVANHLAGRAQPRDVRGIPWVKNYVFDYRFEGPWGMSNVVFTSVAGHIKTSDFTERYRKWNSCDPSMLFEAPIETFVENVTP